MSNLHLKKNAPSYKTKWDRRGRDRMVVGFTTAGAIRAYHRYRFEFEFHSWRDVLDTTLCDKICQLLVAGQ